MPDHGPRHDENRVVDAPRKAVSLVDLRNMAAS